MSRINELKLLELMASPYNQSLIAMIKVELDIAKRVKELKRQQRELNSKSKSKFSLPKHLSSQNSQNGIQDSRNVTTFEKYLAVPTSVLNTAHHRLEQEL